MKKLLAVFGIILAVALGLLFLSWTSTNTGNAVLPNEGGIKIGVISILSGDNAVYGDYAKKGIELAVDEINSKGGVNGKMLGLVWEDDGTNPEKSATAAEKLASTDNVDAVIYASGSGATLSGLPILEKNQIPTIVSTASNPKIKESGDYIFRVISPDSFESVQWVQIVKSEGFKNPAILYVNNAWGVGLKESFTESFGKQVPSEAMQESSIDVKTQLLKLKNLNPDVLLLPCYIKDCITTVKQMQELDFKPQVIAGDVFHRQEILDAVGNSAEGFLATDVAESKSKEWQEFEKKFEAKYGKKPNQYNALNYDAVYVLYYAMLSAGAGGEKIKQEIYKTNFTGPSGLNKFDSFGEVSKPFGLFKVVDGKFVQLS